MRHSALKYALALSVLLNAGVIGAVGYKAVHNGGVSAFPAAEPNAARDLRLTPQQHQQWDALEVDFMRAFQAELDQIGTHREKLIREIFSEQPAAERIEAERLAIARLQTEQQRRVIAQLLKEREILEPSQQQTLAKLLLEQGPAAVERIHRK